MPPPVTVFAFIFVLGCTVRLGSKGCSVTLDSKVVLEMSSEVFFSGLRLLLKWCVVVVVLRFTKYFGLTVEIELVPGLSVEFVVIGVEVVAEIGAYRRSRLMVNVGLTIIFPLLTELQKFNTWITKKACILNYVYLVHSCNVNGLFHCLLTNK